MTNYATARLAKLAAENPTLPIVAMVNFEVVPGDESAYWTGEIASAEIRELWASPREDARTWDREDAEFDYEDFIEIYASNEDLMKIESLTDEKLYKQAAMEWIAGLPWTKCIVIFVEKENRCKKHAINTKANNSYIPLLIGQIKKFGSTYELIKFHIANYMTKDSQESVALCVP